ncbi:diacylglycerol kinase family lipid kinase [Anaerobacillus alkaliphilus]|uniref:Diacylglycerol kinase family lipid kinase n=1 Tax=Anaerobacillus alkaliphilus TaxID=1548597 RepID=A0A4Q0VX39_9BACI|nr:diacylglycerol kinase family protein [Anaerobacillus alkaliphilus]RXJ04030.1 diacylglycerol kinase family lipid kinase [Anaerobacillus alkaliphilus]
MYLFIINNQSGKGAKVWKKTLPILQSKEVNYKAFFITKPEDLLHIETKLMKETIKAIVIIGGDGSIHHALKFVENTEIPIGIIPAGSGNDFARALKIPHKSSEALNLILRGHTKKIDMIKVDDKPCATVVGIGFDAKVAELANRSKIKKWLNFIKLGKLAYIYGVLKGVFSYQSTEMTIHVDGIEKTYSHVWLIALANTPYYGGGLKISPEANYTDGTLNICIVHSLSRLELLLFFPLVFLGKHTLHPSVEMISGKEIEISSTSSVPIQADGEPLGSTPTFITIKNRELHVIV